MAWTAVTTTDVLAEFTGKEQEAVGAAQEAADNLEGILNKVIAMVRGYIVAVGVTLEVGATTVPDQIIPDVIAIARWKLLIATPSLRPLATEERKDAAAGAMARLEDLAKGNIPVEPASTSPGTNIGGNWGGQDRFDMRTHALTNDN